MQEIEAELAEKTGHIDGLKLDLNKMNESNQNIYDENWRRNSIMEEIDDNKSDNNIQNVINFDENQLYELAYNTGFDFDVPKSQMERAQIVGDKLLLNSSSDDAFNKQYLQKLDIELESNDESMSLSE